MRSLLAALLCLLCLPAAWAATLVPANGIISTAGEYYLSANRSSAATTNIQITANNVDLNLSGKTVACTPANPATAVTFGVKVDGANATVRNGKITGCYMGSNASSSPGNVTFMGVDFTGNTYIGVNGGTTFIGNIFADIKGYSTEAYAVAINAPAPGCRVESNVFRNLHRQVGASPSLVGEGVAVLLNSGSTNCTVRWNWMENEVLGPEADIGVWGSGAATNIYENTFTNLGRAIASNTPLGITVNDNRFWMRAPEALSLAVGAMSGSTVTNNTITGYVDAFGGGATDGGGNIVAP